MMRVIVSVIVWIITIIVTLLAFFCVLFIVIFLFPFDRKRKLAHMQAFWWSDCIVGANPFWKVVIEGKENIDRKKTYVIVANHQSMADILIVYKTHLQFKWVAKESLFRIPVFGWCLSMLKYIRLSRGEYGSIKTMYRQAAYWLRNGVSVFFFPEGTRVTTGKIGDFKNGAFKLAIKEKVPILPLRIEGSDKVILSGGWIFKTRVSCRLTVLPAIDTSGYDLEDFPLLRDRVYASISYADFFAKSI